MNKILKPALTLCALLLLLSPAAFAADSQSITQNDADGKSAAVTMRVVKNRSYVVEVPASISFTADSAVNEADNPVTQDFTVSAKNIILPDTTNMQLAVRLSGSYASGSRTKAGFKLAKQGGAASHTVDYSVFTTKAEGGAETETPLGDDGVFARFAGCTTADETPGSAYNTPQTQTGRLRLGEIRYAGSYKGTLTFTVETIDTLAMTE